MIFQQSAATLCCFFCRLSLPLLYSRFSFFPSILLYLPIIEFSVLPNSSFAWAIMRY